MINYIDTHDDSFIHAEITNTFTKDDVISFIPKLENMVEKYGMIRVIVVLKSFKGYTITGFMEDFKFFLAHWNDYCKMAIIGDSEIEKLLAMVSSLMYKGEIRYYDIIHLYKAMEWMQEESPLRTSN